MPTRRQRQWAELRSSRGLAASSFSNGVASASARPRGSAGFFSPGLITTRHQLAELLCVKIIPNKFLDHFGGEILATIELESPRVIVYIVKVTKHMNRTVLNCGWGAFVDANQIEENDSLFFRHIENSRFEVLILDSDGCEKIFSRSGIKRAYNVQERNADPIDIASSTHDNDTMDSSSSGESGEEFTESGSSEHESCHELDDPQTPLVPVLSHGTSLSEAQEEKIAMLIQEIRPEIPVYVAVMKYSNVKLRGSLVIAKHYASAHFPNTSQTITLESRDKNKKWHPKFYIRKDRSGYILYGRWTEFVHDNRLKEGDICIFELTKFTGRNFRATVHLLRETKSHSFGAFCSSPKRVDSGGRTRPRVSLTEGRCGTKGISTNSVKKEPDDGQCNKGEGKHQEPLSSDDSGGSSESYLISQKASLTKAQKRKVKEIACSYESEVPIYASVMNKSNVGTDGSYTIRFGKEFATRYLPRGEQTLTLLMKGKSKAWQIKMCPRSGDAQMFTMDWRAFVHDNCLRIKDICLFQLMNNERRLTMTVHIIRHNDKN
uniref:TF-B3 domain-containing protein n=1 Tax=Leersia perrieri TaxID=77586 RepID=A0A0D9VWG1_9ORYZ